MITLEQKRDFFKAYHKVFLKGEELEKKLEEEDERYERLIIESTKLPISMRIMKFLRLI